MQVIDSGAPTEIQFEEAVTSIRTFLEQGKAVYVHCRNGHGRSPTIGTAYLISEGLTFEEARQKMVEKRPNTYLNSAQHDCLVKYEALHQSRNSNGSNNYLMF